MADTIRIEINIESNDNTEADLEKVNKNLQKVEKTAEKTNEAVTKTNKAVTTTEKNADKATNAVNKADKAVSKFDKSAAKTQKTLASWAKEKYEILLEAKDKISPVLTTLGSGLKGIAGKAWSVTMNAVDLATAPIRGVINLLKNPILQMGAVLGITVGLKDTIDVYKTFEATMSNVKAVSGATATDLGKLTAKAREMGADTKFTATEAGEAFTYMAQAGWQTEAMLDGIEGVLNLAAASGEDLGTTSNIVTDALAAFRLEASDTAHFADVLAQAAATSNTDVGMMGETFKYAGAMAGTLGYSIEDVGLMIGLMANNGIKASQAGTELNTIFTRLSTDTNGAREAIEDLGIQFFDDTGTARDLKSVIDELRVATAGMTDEQKTNLANTIAGTRAQAGLLAILNTEQKTYDSLAESIYNADGAALAMSETMLDNLAGSIELLQSAMDEVKISFGERLAPYVRNIAEWLTDYMPEIEDGMQDLMDWVDIKVEKMKDKFDEITGTQEWQGANFFGKAGILLDEFILDPLDDWWSTTGKAKVASFAGDVGRGIGTGLKVGILTLLGIDISDTVNEATSIGAQFSKGFSEGFDFDLVADKFGEGMKNLFSNALKLLPGGKEADLSSLMSAMLLAKIASPVISVGSTVGKAAVGTGKALFGGYESLGGISLAAMMMGSTGNAMVRGSGILGGLANIGYGLSNTSKAGLYFGTTAGTMSGGMAALTGAGALAGGVAAGASLISAGKDFYGAYKSDDEAEKTAYTTSGGLKAGGVAAGAAAGAAIGSIIPGLGTAVGALIGAGIGGIGGWIAGNKVKDDYEESVEEAKKQAELAQKAFEATGLSIDDVKFRNDALNDALKDTEVTSQELAVMLQEEVAEVMENAFGDIKLSLEEIQNIAGDIVFDGAIDEVTEFVDAVADAQTSLAVLESSVTDLKRENWKVKLGLELSEEDKDGYKKAVDTFVESASQYIEDNHYQATVALSLLTSGTGSTAQLDVLYGQLQTQIESISTQLSTTLEIALSDGVITLDESAEITNLQEQISAITNKVNAVMEEAQLESLKIRYTNGADLDVASFTQMQAELKAMSEEFQANYDEALTLNIANAKLQLSEGLITQEEYDKLISDYTADYQAHINDLNVRVQSFNLDAIATAFDEELAGILPEMKGTTAEKLQEAMEQAFIYNSDATTWTSEDIKKWFGLDSLASSNAEAFLAISEQLKTTAATVPQDVIDSYIQSYKDSLPTAEELMQGIDWSTMTEGGYQDMYQGLYPGTTWWVSSDWSASDMFKDNENFDVLARSACEEFEKALQNSTDPDAIRAWLDTYFTVNEAPDFSSVMAQYGPISNEYYQQLLTEWATTGNGLGGSMNTGVQSELLGAGNLYRTGIQSALSDATSNPFAISPFINISPRYTLLGGLPYSTTKVDENAAGGFVSGGPKLSWLAEEGYGEFVIPTNPSRRGRALELWKQAGQMLGVGMYANGGFVGGSNSDLGSADGYLLAEAITNATRGGNEVTEGGNSVVAGVNVGAGGGTSVQVSVQMSPEFTISGSDGMNEDDIMAVIRRNMKSMADELGGEIAERLDKVFSNMPLKEA